MKISVIGTGKTGSHIASILQESGQLHAAYDSSSTLSADDLNAADAAIVFVPHTGFDAIASTLIETTTPIVIGTTAIDFDSYTDQLQAAGSRWLVGSNFSIGMNLMFVATRLFAQWSHMTDDVDYRIEETHHVHKKDSPSGTALTLQKSLGFDVPIKDYREGDVAGIHELHVDTPTESLFMKHDAKNRKIFAQGAIWAAENMTQELPTGISHFEDLMREWLVKNL